MILYLLAYIYDERDEWQDESQTFWSPEPEYPENYFTRNWYLFNFYIAWWLYKPTILIVRPITFCLVYLLTICCDSGEIIPDDYDWNKTVIGRNFVEYQMNAMSNFENVGNRQDIRELNADIVQVREHAIERQQSLRRAASILVPAPTGQS